MKDLIYLVIELFDYWMCICAKMVQYQLKLDKQKHICT